MSYGKSIDFLFNQMRSAGAGSLASGWLYFYTAGTTIPKPIYLDRDMLNQAANPYQLSADGTAELFGDGLYRIVIKDSDLVTIYDYDNVLFQDLSVTTAASSITARDYFYRMTLDNVQFRKCYMDLLDSTGTFTLSGSPLPVYSSVDFSYYGTVGSILTTPNITFDATYTRAYLYLEQDATVNATIEYSLDGGGTWAALGIDGYITATFTTLKFRISFQGPGKIYSYGLFYDFYGAYIVAHEGIFSSSAFTDLTDAVTVIGSGIGTIYIDAAINVGSAPLVIPSNIAVEVSRTGSITLDNNLTINGAFTAGEYKVFYGSASIAFGTESIRLYNPKWISGTIASNPVVWQGAGFALPDTINGKTYQITIENGILTPVEV